MGDGRYQRAWGKRGRLSFIDNFQCFDVNCFVAVDHKYSIIIFACTSMLYKPPLLNLHSSVACVNGNVNVA